MVPNDGLTLSQTTWNFRARGTGYLSAIKHAHSDLSAIDSSLSLVSLSRVRAVPYPRLCHFVLISTVVNFILALF
jgi:hypothetical protein